MSERAELLSNKRAFCLLPFAVLGIELSVNDSQKIRITYGPRSPPLRRVRSLPLSFPCFLLQAWRGDFFLSKCSASSVFTLLESEWMNGFLMRAREWEWLYHNFNFTRVHLGPDLSLSMLGSDLVLNTLFTLPCGLRQYSTTFREGVHHSLTLGSPVNSYIASAGAAVDFLHLRTLLVQPTPQLLLSLSLSLFLAFIRDPSSLLAVFIFSCNPPSLPPSLPALLARFRSFVNP